MVHTGSAQRGASQQSSRARSVGGQSSKTSTCTSTTSCKSADAEPRRTRLWQMWQATSWKLPKDCAERYCSPSGHNPRKVRLPKAILQDSTTEEIITPILPPMCATREDADVLCHKAFPEEVDHVSVKNLEYYEAFRKTCRERFSSIIRAWRLLLDPDGVGRVSYLSFCQKARSIGFKDVNRLWAIIDIDHSGFLTMDEWDRVAFRNLYEFRDICMKQFGNMVTAFDFGMDTNGSGTCDSEELQQFCKDYGFSGNVRILFAALDLEMKNFVTRDNLEFLQKWQGERFSSSNRHFDFGVARLRKLRQRHTQHGSKEIPTRVDQSLKSEDACG